MSQAFLNRIIACERQMAILEARIYLLEKPANQVVDQVEEQKIDMAVQPKRRGRPPKNNP